MKWNEQSDVCFSIADVIIHPNALIREHYHYQMVFENLISKKGITL